VVVVLDPTIVGTVDVAEGLKESGMLIINTSKSPADMRRQLGLQGRRLFTVNASHIAIEELGRDITNTPILGALAKATGLFSPEELIEQTRHRFGKKFSTEIVEANVRAIERASKEVQEG
jgi:pyruvate ferredoxin oxidoreductase gamma subunit